MRENNLLRHHLIRSFIRHIELWLSAAGLVVILAVPGLLAEEGSAFWRIAALTAMGVGVLHGAIFWVIRRRQQRIREHSIAEIREMLSDVVKNQLAVMRMYLPRENDQIVEAELKGIKASIDQISEQVDALSEESLTEWKTHYREAVTNATTLETA